MHTPQEREQEQVAFGCVGKVLLALVLTIFGFGLWVGILLVYLLQW